MVVYVIYYFGLLTGEETIFMGRPLFLFLISMVQTEVKEGSAV